MEVLLIKKKGDSHQKIKWLVNSNYDHDMNETNGMKVI